MRHMISILLALILAVALPANQVGAAVSGVTVGTSPALVLAAPATRGYRLVVIRNQSGSATIACAPDNATPAIGAAGSFDIAAGAERTWSAAGVVFAGAWYCIASGASTPVTIEAE